MENSSKSENALGADNQQERPKIIGWVAGFVDGEGTFSVSVFRNKTSKFGWQVFTEFIVTQGEKSLPALEFLQNFFGCGKIFINRRKDNHKEDIYRYCVRSVKDLQSIIIPFFEINQLKTAKRNDFRYFRQILEMIGKRKPLDPQGLRTIALITKGMNDGGA